MININKIHKILKRSFLVDLILKVQLSTSNFQVRSKMTFSPSMSKLMKYLVSNQSGLVYFLAGRVDTYLHVIAHKHLD